MSFDRFGREIKYLRISLTDHCNLRCIYCMPEEMTFQPTVELMQDDEIFYFTRLFAELGFTKIRLTGGEPTVRPNVVGIVREIASTPGIDCVTMTTNGILLARLAESLAKAGLKRINISLDSLNPDRFKQLTRWGDMQDIWLGVKAAEEAGLTPIKINAVVVGGFNEGEVVDLARMSINHPWQVRFIEMMPFGGDTDFQIKQTITAAQVREKVENALGPLSALNGDQLDGEARMFQIPGAKGEIGFISSISEPFCANCSRARLTADGVLRMCLLREHELDLLSHLRSGASKAEIRQLILEAIWNKPWGHSLANGEIARNRAMNQIGG
jgi:cyclic pyranopterin phosphate synthase